MLRIPASDGLVLAEPGRSAWAFPFANHLPGVLFNFRTDDQDAQFQHSPAESLRHTFGPNRRGSAENLFQQFEAADEVRFDSTHQVEMPT